MSQQTTPPHTERTLASPSRRLGTGWPAFPAPFESTTRRVVVAGDWHGTMAWAAQVIDAARGVGADTVIVAGDHAMVWPGDPKRSGKLNRLAAAAQVRVVLVPGNHDWHDKLDAVPTGPDGFARLEEWVWHAPRPTRWQVAGVRFAALGGAHSVDADRRIEGKSWWRSELITEQHVQVLGTEKVDILITHEAPAREHLHAGMRLSFRDAAISDRQRELVATAARNTRPRLVLHGHWHQRTTGRLPYPDGTSALVVSLDQQYTRGNWVVLDLPDVRLHDPRSGDVPPLT